MRLAIVAVQLVLACVAPAAFAQPVTHPAHCEVTITRAPDDVRRVIESWVSAEPRCTATLEVRVVATDGGLYLLVRDATGRIRERVVPDAQSAGVLVASWVADDSSATLEAPPASVDVVPPRQEHGLAVLPPGETAAISPEVRPVLATVGTRASIRHGRWLTLGAMTQVGGSGGGGVRGELDLWSRGKWSLGAGLAVSGADLVLYGTRSEGYLGTRDVRVVATVARTTEWKRWQLRLAAGAGVVRTSGEGFVDDDSIAATGVFPAAEASALVTRTLGQGWGVAAGPVVTWYGQLFGIHTTPGATMELQPRELETMAFLGLRRRL